MSSLSRLGRVVVIGLLGLLLLACADVSSAGTSGNTGGGAARTPVFTPAPRAQVGQTVQAGGWLITVHKLTTFGGGTFDAKPGPGNTYLLIDVTMKNIAHTQQSTNQYDYTLHTPGGAQQKNVYLVDYSDFGGQVTPGEQVRGSLPFEVPVKTHQYILAFTPQVYPLTTLAEWDITLP